MGHASGIKSVYARYDPAQEKLVEEYLKIQSGLSIYEHSSTSRVSQSMSTPRR